MIRSFLIFLILNVLCFHFAWAEALFVSPSASIPPLPASSTFVRVPLIVNKEMDAMVKHMLAPSRLIILASRIRNALEADPEWSHRQIDIANPGHPIPYSPKLGISFEEYQEFLNLSGRPFKFEDAYPIKILFKKEEGFVTIHTQPSTPLEGIKMSHNELITPLGSNEGLLWEEYFSPNQIVKFYMGHLQEQGEGIIYYSVKTLKGHNKSFTFIVTFPASIPAQSQSPLSNPAPQPRSDKSP